MVVSNEALVCRVGERHGPYQLERRIGGGGMGEVFAARRVGTDEVVAVKTLSKAHATLRYRFKREFRALADVEHRNLVRLGELVVSDAGPSFFTMELLDGSSFTSWVRRATPPGRLPDLARMEGAVRQLVEGLECLHANNCVHRDLKPSNVMVTREGRVVILDFGIISEIGDSDHGMTRDGQILGTPIYMPPERASGARGGPAADYYAVGVIVYECLTGQLPFAGPAMSVLLDKQLDTTPDPGLVFETIPARWRDLCVQLLHRDPNRRPTGSELLVKLGVGGPRLRPAEAVFIGRQAEFEVLRRALADVGEHRQAVIVHLRGRSGVGKSTLVREFMAEVQSEWLVLRGRCRERETIPYKGVDAVVDALSVHLRHLDEGERESLRPRYVGALARVFPVLEEIWVADEHELLGPDPHEARSLGWASLRDLLTQLATRGRLLVVIEDFQWADLDSAAILRALTRAPDAPPMALVITGLEASSDLLGWLEADDEPAAQTSALRRLELGPLPELEARELALSLLRARMDPNAPIEPGPLHSRAEAIALRCAGSPFFIDQMVLGGDALGAGTDLDQIVIQRLAQLEGPARSVLEVVAVAGGPLAQSLVIELSALARSSASDGLAQVDALCALGMLVRDESGPRHAVEAAHDRIRSLSLAELSPERRRALHWAIGERLLARSGPEPAGEGIFAIADHLDAGLPSLDSLTNQQRLDLAQLQHRAGERALASAAWTSARRYFGLGHRLIEPWLAEVRRGRGPRELGLAIEFGRARVEALAKSDIADEAFEDLLTWSLSNVEIGQIVAQRISILRRVDRAREAVDCGLAGLARLGSKYPRNPSTLRGVLAAVRGWLTLGKRDIDGLLALPEIRDEQERARLDVLIELTVTAFSVSPALYLLAAGRMARAIHRHGYHPRVTTVLVTLAVTIGVLGKAHEAAAMVDRVRELGKARPISPLDSLNTRMMALVILPATRPFSGLASDLEALHRECCNCDLQEVAGFVAGAGASLCNWTDLPLPAFAAMLNRLEVRNPGFGGMTSFRAVDVVRRYVNLLISGGSWTVLECDDLILEYADLACRIFAAVQSCDYDQAKSLVVPADFERVMMGGLSVPMLAMFSAILEAQRWPLASASERRRSWRALRRLARTTRRYAARGPENFGPVADIVEGEIAAIRGRFDHAMAAYERARASATANRGTAITGLACMRLARLGHRRGHAIMAQSAFDAALAIYTGWGAAALVAGLRDRGLAGI